MSIADILIILGCLAVGYWIVSSVMGPGIDIIDAGRKSEAQKDAHSSQRSVTAAPEPPMRDWHIVLDVPVTASRSDILAAQKRRLAQASAAGDTASMARIVSAAETGLKQAR